jgi:hypothetical protein
MSNIVQWAIVAFALAISIWVLARKFKKQASGKCDGCCERCKLHDQPVDCSDYKANH